MVNRIVGALPGVFTGSMARAHARNNAMSGRGEVGAVGAMRWSRALALRQTFEVWEVASGLSIKHGSKLERVSVHSLAPS
jgi:hypothetical protein